MRYKIVAVKDRVLDSYSVPTFVHSVGAAIRSFSDEIKRVPRDGEQNPLNKHPEGFDLFYLGEYDDESGVFAGELPKQVSLGKDWV